LGGTVCTARFWAIYGATQDILHSPQNESLSDHIPPHQPHQADLLGGPGVSGKFDKEHNFRVIILSSAFALFGGLTQITTSVCHLRIISGKVERSRKSRARLWLLTNLIVMCFIVGGFLGALAIEEQPSPKITRLMISTGVDLMIIVLFRCFVDWEELHRGRNATHLGILSNFV